MKKFRNNAEIKIKQNESPARQHSGKDSRQHDAGKWRTYLFNTLAPRYEKSILQPRTCKKIVGLNRLWGTSIPPLITEQIAMLFFLEWGRGAMLDPRI